MITIMLPIHKDDAMHNKQPFNHHTSKSVESKTYAKWRKMHNRGFDMFLYNHPLTFLKRFQKGVPQEFRWEAWRVLLHYKHRNSTTRPKTTTSDHSGTNDDVLITTISHHRAADNKFERTSGFNNNDCLFSTLTKAFYIHMADIPSPFSTLIAVDTPRTFPEVNSFDSNANIKLSRILNAYANYNPEVGYCQGMNFVVGFLLIISNFNEFETFEVFCGLMSIYDAQDLYRENFPLLRHYVLLFDIVLQHTIPKLHHHFKKQELSSSLFFHQWVLTLFVRCLPFKATAVVWDYFLANGLDSVISVSVSILKVFEKFLIHLSFEKSIKLLKSLSYAGHSDEVKIGKMLIRRALEIKLPLPFPQNDFFTTSFNDNDQANPSYTCNTQMKERPPPYWFTPKCKFNALQLGKWKSC